MLTAPVKNSCELLTGDICCLRCVACVQRSATYFAVHLCCRFQMRQLSCISWRQLPRLDAHCWTGSTCTTGVSLTLLPTGVLCIQGVTDCSSATGTSLRPSSGPRHISEGTFGVKGVRPTFPQSSRHTRCMRRPASFSMRQVYHAHLIRCHSARAVMTQAAEAGRARVPGVVHQPGGLAAGRLRAVRQRGSQLLRRRGALAAGAFVMSPCNTALDGSLSSPWRQSHIVVCPCQRLVPCCSAPAACIWFLCLGFASGCVPLQEAAQEAKQTFSVPADDSQPLCALSGTLLYPIHMPSVACIGRSNTSCRRQTAATGALV